jgi:hypothetical protein
MPLTDRTIRTIKPGLRASKHSDGGLYLYVPVTGSKLWRLGYRFHGKQKTLYIGGYGIDIMPLHVVIASLFMDRGKTTLPHLFAPTKVEQTLH